MSMPSRESCHPSLQVQGWEDRGPETSPPETHVDQSGPEFVRCGAAGGGRTPTGAPELGAGPRGTTGSGAAVVGAAASGRSGPGVASSAGEVTVAAGDGGMSTSRAADRAANRSIQRTGNGLLQVAQGRSIKLTEGGIDVVRIGRFQKLKDFTDGGTGTGSRRG